MSSTTAAERRPWSLAARLTLWYALSAFVLVFVATGYLYFALSRNLDREDDQFLADKVKSVRAILESSPLDEAALRREAEGANAQRESERIMLRVLNEGGGVRAETPGMAEAMRMQTLAKTPFAMLSRAVVGCRGATLIVNLPGSPKGVRECLEVVLQVLPHAIELVSGRRTEHAP